MFSENTALSNGAGNNIFAGRIQNGMAFRRGLIKFDVSAVPSDAIIQSVVLDLYVFRSARSSTTPHNFDIHKVLNDWGEAGSSGNGSGAAAQTGDATWSQRLYPNTDWTASGGDYETILSASQMVAYSSFNLEKDEWSSAQMVSDVLSWLANPSTNYGWILIGDETINGSAKGFASKEMAPPFDYARPKLSINYTIPSDNRIILNEVNAQKRRIELYNSDTSAVDISNYTLLNGSTTSTISGGNVSVLNGSLMLDSAAYIVLHWPDLNQNDGEVALYNGDTTSGDLIDYIQYGSGTQVHAGKAVTEGVWDNIASFLSTEADSGKSYSLNTAQSYANGTESNMTNWLSQLETPTYNNNPCPSSLNLKGILVEADYASSDFIELEGSINAPKAILINAANAIYLKPGLEVEMGNVLNIEISACPE
ncbi:hypothetical protein DJ013_14305 [Arcticibacterium luteifluviistationis]|uniref:LTD domain-containing protein n=2 Tax=Arcticibacterium luteifluviistationis TaxID=1784714 RepID=A0A2Z4GEK5_9BACT|nr:hypothetical protein DJ013_14305 [Arcticibacterium luteifluviistationis]